MTVTQLFPALPRPRAAIRLGLPPIRRVLVVLAAALALAPPAVAMGKPDWLDGRDMQLYLDATSRWLAGGPFYEPYQLAGPYAINHGDILYPPFAILLFAPFTILPTFLWWAIPVAIVGWVLWSLRPSAVGWIAIFLCLAWPTLTVKFSTGNPVLWVIAAVALAVRFGWPGVLVLIKPTLAPFALVGIRKRSWWLALGGLVLVSLPFGAMWADWLTAVGNSREGGILYSMFEVPMLAMPIIADLTRTRPRVSRAPNAASGSGRDSAPAPSLEPTASR